MFKTFYVILLAITIVKGSVFSVPFKLANIFTLEENIIGLLDQNNYTKTQESYLELCKPRFEEIPLKLEDDKIGVYEHKSQVLNLLAGNPIHVFSLLRRSVINLPELIEELKSTTLSDKVTNLMEDVEMPGELDREGSSQALARLQFSYRLDPVDLAKGAIAGHQTSAKLYVDELMEIAERRASGIHPIRPQVSKEFALAIEWAEAALKIDDKTNGNEEKVKIEKKLKHWRKQHNQNWFTSVRGNGNLPTEAFFVSKIGEEQTGIELREEEDKLYSQGKFAGFAESGYNVHDFYALCQGKKSYNNMNPPIGRCFLSDQNDPYFILSPLKIEIISEDPMLKLYHGIITEKELQFMTQTISSKLEEATVQSDGKGGSKVSNERTQSHGWLWDQEGDMLLDLAKRTARFTGLHTHRPADQLLPEVQWRFVEAEAWQMGLYGPGGHYLPHYDAFDEASGMLPPDVHEKSLDNLWVGNRIATVMFYLSDVVGGFTAFPNIGVATRPSKGTAVMWYNLHEDGRKDDRTLHGGCPTLLGVKWVSNKWIREGSQIWKRPCGIKPNCMQNYHC